MEWVGPSTDFQSFVCAVSLSGLTIVFSAKIVGAVSQKLKKTKTWATLRSRRIQTCMHAHLLIPNSTCLIREEISCSLTLQLSPTPSNTNQATTVEVSSRSSNKTGFNAAFSCYTWLHPPATWEGGWLTGWLRCFSAKYCIKTISSFMKHSAKWVYPEWPGEVTWFLSPLQCK